MKCPRLLPALIIADDARLAAQISCLAAQPGTYLSVIDGPRMARMDHEVEVVRRNNAVARVKPDVLFLAGLSDTSHAAMQRFAGRLASKAQRISNVDDVQGQPVPNSAPFVWGCDRIGVGLLKALRSQSRIVFTDDPSPVEHVPSKSGHLVVCEDGDGIAQVIAANYAYALRAGLCLIPEVSGATTESLLERFYNVNQVPGVSATDEMEDLKRMLRDLCGPLPVPPGGSITFVTGGLPYGFAHPEAPSTHLFKYPDLGISVINGLAAEQEGTRGVGVAVLVDPETTEAPEIAAAAKLLPPTGMLVRCYSGHAANVRAVRDIIELFPYDLLIVATHCGDAPGYRWTYQFTDTEGIDRKLVVDIAIGVAQTDQDDLLNVTQFERFVALDDVDWNDPNKSEKLYVGKAIVDFMELSRSDSPSRLEPTKKETVPRVVGSAVLKMADHNYIALPRPIASEGMPILINNACVSWHQLAKTFTFGNARVYIGTLFEVLTSEAHDVVVKLLDKHFGKHLPLALWAAQREVYGDSVRRPYVMTGVYPQRLRVLRHHVPHYVASCLSRARAAWIANLKQADPSDTRRVKALTEYIAFHDRELAALKARWGIDLAGAP